MCPLEARNIESRWRLQSSQLLDRVSSRGDPVELLREITSLLQPVVPFDFVLLALLDSTQQIMNAFVWPESTPGEPIALEAEKSAVGFVWQNQITLCFSDISSEMRFEAEFSLLRQSNIHSYCVVPLASSGRKIGAIGFGRNSVNVFQPADLHVLSLIADMLALAVDKGLPASEAERETARLRSLIEKDQWDFATSNRGPAASVSAESVGQLHGIKLMELHGSADQNDPLAFFVPEVLMQSEQLLAAYFRASRVGLCIFDSNFRYLATNETLAQINNIPVEAHLGKTVREILGDFAEVIEPLLQRVLQTGEPIFSLELSSTLPARKELGHWIEHYIPIRNPDGEVAQVGAIVVEVTEQKKLEESLRGVSETLQQERKRQQTLLGVSQLLSSNLDVREIFPQISAYIRRVLRQEYASLSLRDERNGKLIRQSIDFPLRKCPDPGPEVNVAEHPAARVLQERAPRILEKSEIQGLQTPAANHLLTEGLQSLCCVPLMRPPGPVGVLVLGSTRANAFNDGDLELLNQVADQLAIALENARTAREIERLKVQLGREKRHLEGEPRRARFEGIIGGSAALQKVLDQIEVVAQSDATVLLLGETGTGKGLMAKALRHASRRQGKPFITLNCAAIPTGLLESELFGHEKGAFTGAISQKIGRFELADQGTLFLDEIGEISRDLQPKLLRVLQDREFERLGGNRTIRIDLRLIAATNRDLARSVAENEFRSDLYYRLNVFPVRLPPLRERREDIPDLIRYFVKKYAARMGRVIETMPTAIMDALINWDWPGNVRELENIIERSVILTEGPALHVPVDELIRDKATERSLESAEREHIIQILRETGGVLSGPKGAAARLDLKRTTLQSMMDRLGIRRENYIDSEPS
jgi:formate hydrogenlyase transcriptional activator